MAEPKTAANTWLMVGMVVSLKNYISKEHDKRKTKKEAWYVVIKEQALEIPEEERKQKGLQGYYRKIVVRLMTNDRQDDPEGEEIVFFTPKIGHYHEEIAGEDILIHDRLKSIFV